METQWDDSGREGWNGQRKKISKVNEKGKREKVTKKKQKVNGTGRSQGEKGVPPPQVGLTNKRFGGLI